MKLYLFIVLILCGLISCSTPGRPNKYQEITSIKETTFPGITGSVHDAETDGVLSARIVITDRDSNVVRSYYRFEPGFFTNEDGTFEQKLEPGTYRIEVYHGFDYLSQDTTLNIAPGHGFDMNIFMQPWVSLKDLGWVNGGGHCHLYTEKVQDDSMLMMVRRICLGQGVDFLCAAQGWGGYTDSTWREGYAKFTDNRFILHYGSEMPKYRTGHTWWLGQKSTRGYFWKTMDENYENKYYQSPTRDEWNFDDLGFPYIPCPEVIQRIRKADDAVAIIPHPTSWWWQPRGKITKYTTNVAAYLSFGLLSGKIWDGEVVMGYNHDHYMYQNLWFNVLNQGYRMPAMAELDGGLGNNDRFYYGSMRTYYYVGDTFDIAHVTDAVRRGETFVTSGPIIKADVDQKYRIGQIIRPEGSPHELHIQAWASGDRKDFLSYVVVYRNGQIFKLWDIRDKKPRTFKESVSINETEPAWYVIKVYGRRAWSDPEYLDILKTSQKMLYDSLPASENGPHDVAITSAFYFWPEGTQDPKPLESDVNLSLVSSNGKPVEKVTVDVLLNGTSIKTEQVFNGKAHFKMPVNSLLKITSNDHKTIYRGLFLDYKPHLKLLEKLATGKWMDDYNPAIPFSPGEVPWEAYNFNETRDLLSDVNWRIIIVPNERDDLWGGFEALFNSHR